MRIARTATSIIWRTVVSAGALLALPACPRNSTPCVPEESEGAMTPQWDVGPAVPSDPVPGEEGEVPEEAEVLEPQYALTIVSEPAGATVRLGDVFEPVGTTPVQVTVPGGEVKVRLEYEGYADAVEVFPVNEDTDARVRMVSNEDAFPRSRCQGSGPGRGFILS